MTLLDAGNVRFPIMDAASHGTISRWSGMLMSEVAFRPDAELLTILANKNLPPEVRAAAAVFHSVLNPGTPEAAAQPVHVTRLAPGLVPLAPLFESLAAAIQRGDRPGFVKIGDSEELKVGPYTVKGCLSSSNEVVVQITAPCGGIVRRFQWVKERSDTEVVSLLKNPHGQHVSEFCRSYLPSNQLVLFPAVSAYAKDGSRINELTDARAQAIEDREDGGAD